MDMQWTVLLWAVQSPHTWLFVSWQQHDGLNDALRIVWVVSDYACPQEMQQHLMHWQGQQVYILTP
jgi:hypothetical protein